MAHGIRLAIVRACREKLLKKRHTVEDEIVELANKKGLLHREDFDKKSVQYEQEWEKVVALINAKFAELKKINLRIDEIDRGEFNNKCANCEKKLSEGYLLENPMRKFCLACQQKENNGKKK